MKIGNTEYKIEKNEEAFNEEEFSERWTEDFVEYDYIVGDYSYNKLRIKGFYDKKNKKVKDYNNIEKLDEYIENNCAYMCKYFILKKIN